MDDRYKIIAEGIAGIQPTWHLDRLTPPPWPWEEAQEPMRMKNMVQVIGTTPEMRKLVNELDTPEKNV